MFIVVDGMGGLADAAATAQLVVDQLPSRVCRSVSVLNRPDVAGAVGDAAAEFNERVRSTARCGPGTAGAAAALLLIRDGLALAVHLGDSRIYLARGGRIHRLTDDHSHDGQLTRFIGMAGDAIPGVSVHELDAGDRMLLCTDGLTGCVSDQELAEVLRTVDEVDHVCAQLIDVAAAGGAIDDISLIAVEYGGRARA
jgi:protein phosphatase